MKTVQITLNHDPIMGDNDDYYAIGTLTGVESDPMLCDYENETVRVIWETINPEDPDGSNACDWENPDGVKESGAWLFDGEVGINSFKGYKVIYIDAYGCQL